MKKLLVFALRYAKVYVVLWLLGLLLCIAAPAPLAALGFAAATISAMLLCRVVFHPMHLPLTLPLSRRSLGKALLSLSLIGGILPFAVLMLRFYPYKWVWFLLIMPFYVQLPTLFFLRIPIFQNKTTEIFYPAITLFYMFGMLFPFWQNFSEPLAGHSNFFQILSLIIFLFVYVMMPIDCLRTLKDFARRRPLSRDYLVLQRRPYQ